MSTSNDELRQIVTDALVAMISGVTGLVPPSGPGSIPDFVQAPIDRAVEKISAGLPVGGDLIVHPKGVQNSSHPALIALDKQCRDDVARALGLTPSADRGFAWSLLLNRVKGVVADAARSASAIAEAKAWCDENGGTPAEFLSHQLLVKRCEVLGRPLTWREAIELTALTTSMPDDERDKLLALDDEPGGEA